MEEVAETSTPMIETSGGRMPCRRAHSAVLMLMVFGGVGTAIAVWKSGGQSSASAINGVHLDYMEKLFAQQPAVRQLITKINATADMEMFQQAGLNSNLSRLLYQDSLSLQKKGLPQHNMSIEESVAKLRKLIEQQQEEDFTEMADNNPQLKTAECVFHALQAALYLSEAGSAINSASVNCPEGLKHGSQPSTIGQRRGERASMVCAVEIQAVLSSFGWAAYFLASAVSTCGVDNLVADCAAQATGLTTSFVNIAESATGMAVDCDKKDLITWATKTKANVESKFFKGRGHQETAYCVLDPIQATYWLARAGLTIQNAVADCVSSQENCAADGLFIVMSFGWAAGFIAMAASDCADYTNMKAMCASDAAGVVASVTMAAGEAIFVDTSCKGTQFMEALHGKPPWA